MYTFLEVEGYIKEYAITDALNFHFKTFYKRRIANFVIFQDAVDKYAMWMKKYGSQRAQRNTNIDLSSLLFVPHR